MMKAFLATVLSVIAVGVMVIAYGLLNPRTAAADVSAYPSARPMFASERVGFIDDRYPASSPYAGTTLRPAAAYPVSAWRAVQAYDTYSAPAPRRVTTVARTTRTVPIQTRVARAPSRDWTKTA